MSESEIAAGFADAEVTAAELETVVLAVPGVTRLYPVGTAAQILDAGAKLLGAGESSPIRLTDEGAEIALGVDGSLGAPAVVRAVNAAVGPLLGDGAEARATIVRIER